MAGRRELDLELKTKIELSLSQGRDFLDKKTIKHERKNMSEKAPLFWISGNYFDCRATWEDFKNRNPNANIVDIECGFSSEGDTKSACMRDVIMELKNNDLFDSSPKIIRVYGLPPDYTTLFDYLHLIDNQHQVVLYGTIGYYIPAGVSSRFISAKTSSLYKTINGWKQVFEFPIEFKTNEQAIAWISNLVERFNKPITPEAANLLVMNKGRNLDVLYGELKRLIAYSENKKIETSDVETISIPEFTKTVWDLIDSLDLRQYEAALRHLQQFYMHAEPLPAYAFDQEVMELMGALEHHYSFIALIQKGGRSFNDAYAAVKGIKKREKIDAAWSYGEKEMYDYGYMKMNFSKPAVQAALSWEQNKIWEVLLDIYRCAHICRISDASTKRQALEVLVMHVCGLITLERARKMRVQGV